MWILISYSEEHLKEVILNKILSFDYDMLIDKKINNVKEDSRRKIDSNFDFSKALRCLLVPALWGFNKKEYYVVHIIELFIHHKRLK